MPDDEFSITEQLSFMDMLQPWPHHLHVHEDFGMIFASCDCGWIGSNGATYRGAVVEYRDHVDRPE